MNGVAVATDWAHSWAKRAVIKNAIRLTGLNRGSAKCNAREDGTTQSCHKYLTISNILELGDLERVVFVMSVLERYSDRDSAGLLGRVTQEVREARVQALRHIAGF